MPASEIDDIFASKGKGKGKAKDEPVEVVVVKDKLKKKKKRKADVLDDDAKPTPSSSKAVAVTVFKEPTASDASSAKRQKTGKAAESSSAKPAKAKKSVKEDEDRFKDSRGTGPRKRTEEGWAVYKEDELGIQDEGGDTPLCPFDCDCCKSTPCTHSYCSRRPRFLTLHVTPPCTTIFPTLWAGIRDFQATQAHDTFPDPFSWSVEVN
ncbi:DUF1764-domain-containing protein [Exidia glandulosa HHB12029]|uniref:DUF1764-domain-containing protein n=1 Tax=Exidia glandulosa HHB12029 TaxID=1314781 RepID=A0A165I3J4_EXIGL|nr:DUF1764-domain-containing protein [Exidia glandulosa HHB12029]